MKDRKSWADVIQTLRELYSKDKQTEKEIGERTLFTIFSNSIKYLGFTLTTQVK